MIEKTKLLAAALAIAFGVGASGCDTSGGDRRAERWATTENTKVQIDWNAVNEAYKQAHGPGDLERRINEIYQGDEVISISVADVDARTQIVTGFFDKNANGAAEDAEKIFTIRRDITGDDQAQFQTTGHGPYSGYASPFFSMQADDIKNWIQEATGNRPLGNPSHATLVKRADEVNAEIKTKRESAAA